MASKHYENQTKRMRRCSDRIYDAVQHTIHFKLTHKELLETLSSIYSSDDWKKLTVGNRERIRGRFDVWYADIQKHLYFAYKVNGRVITFDQWRSENPNGDASVVFSNNNGNHYYIGTTKPY